MDNNVEHEVKNLKDEFGKMERTLDRIEILLENQQKESERHNKKMEEILGNQSSINEFMRMTTHKVDENASKIKTLKSHFADSTKHGCSALQLAVSDDKLDKEHMKQVKQDIADIKDGQKWMRRALISTIISGVLGGFIGLIFFVLRGLA